MLLPIVSSMFPAIDSIFIGAQPKTQTLDIMHGLQGVIEKGLDSFGQSAVAQMDIKRFYDSIKPLRIYRYLVRNGADPTVEALQSAKETWMKHPARSRR